MDQMDVIKRFVQNYTLTFMYATTADDIDEAFKANKVYTLYIPVNGSTAHMHDIIHMQFRRAYMAIQSHSQPPSATMMCIVVYM